MVLVEVMSDGLSTGMMTSDVVAGAVSDPDVDAALLIQPEILQKKIIPNRHKTKKNIVPAILC